MSESQTLKSPSSPLSPALPVPSKRFTHLTPAERVTIHELAAKGRTTQEIAKAVGRDWDTVNKATKRGAELLALYPERFVRHWTKASAVAAKKGDHGPARDALLYGKQIDQLEDRTAQTGVTVMVGLVPPGLGLSPSSPTLIGQTIPVSDEE